MAVVAASPVDQLLSTIIDTSYLDTLQKEVSAVFEYLLGARQTDKILPEVSTLSRLLLEYSCKNSSIGDGYLSIIRCVLVENDQSQNVGLVLRKLDEVNSLKRKTLLCCFHYLHILYNLKMESPYLLDNFNEIVPRPLIQTSFRSIEEQDVPPSNESMEVTLNFPSGVLQSITTLSHYTILIRKKLGVVVSSMLLLFRTGVGYTVPFLKAILKQLRRDLLNILPAGLATPVSILLDRLARVFELVNLNAPSLLPLLLQMSALLHACIHWMSLGGSSGNPVDSLLGVFSVVPAPSVVSPGSSGLATNSGSNSTILSMFSTSSNTPVNPSFSRLVGTLMFLRACSACVRAGVLFGTSLSAAIRQESAEFRESGNRLNTPSTPPGEARPMRGRFMNGRYMSPLTPSPDFQRTRSRLIHGSNDFLNFQDSAAISSNISVRSGLNGDENGASHGPNIADNPSAATDNQYSNNVDDTASVTSEGSFQLNERVPSLVSAFVGESTVDETLRDALQAQELLSSSRSQPSDESHRDSILPQIPEQHDVSTSLEVFPDPSVDINKKEVKSFDDNDENLLQSDRDFACVICMKPRRAATATPCGHVFCWKCIFNWTISNKYCPICREKCNPQELLCLY